MAGMSVARAAAELVAALDAACHPATPELEAVAALREYGQIQRQLDYQVARLITLLDRRGTFADLGYRRTGEAIADLWGCDRAVAHRRVRAAGDVFAQASPSGEPLPPRLPATASAFEGAELDLAHVEVISAVMRSGPASRICPEDWRTVEEQLAGYAVAGAKPADLKSFAQQLVGLLDQDGSAPRRARSRPGRCPAADPRPDGGGMLACDAMVIPAVLGGASQPLDLGRAMRTASAAVRRAVVIRDRGCAFPGCNRPPSWCDVHHIREWSDGGETSPDNCVLLCGFHHRLIHQGGWAMLMSGGVPEFIAPKWIDPSQKSRRKPPLRQ